MKKDFKQTVYFRSLLKPGAFHVAANIMIYINSSTDKYQNNINKQSYLKLSLFHDKSIPLYHQKIKKYLCYNPITPEH